MRNQAAGRPRRERRAVVDRRSLSLEGATTAIITTASTTIITTMITAMITITNLITARRSPASRGTKGGPKEWAS